MAETHAFKAAYAYQEDILALPVADLDTASAWYTEHFGMEEVERREDPPTVILERDGTRIGFAINGGDATQDGASIRVSHIEGMRDELEGRGVQIGNWRIDEGDDGEQLRVFFVVAPDGLCYYFHEPIHGG